MRPLFPTLIWLFVDCWWGWGGGGIYWRAASAVVVGGRCRRPIGLFVGSGGRDRLMSGASRWLMVVVGGDEDDRCCSFWSIVFRVSGLEMHRLRKILYLPFLCLSARFMLISSIYACQHVLCLSVRCLWAIEIVRLMLVRVCGKLKIEFTQNDLLFQSGLSGWSFFFRQKANAWFYHRGRGLSTN